MKFIKLKSTDPYYNLAVEEYLFRNSCDDIFMLWQNDRTVVIGKNQNAYAEVNLEYAKENNILLSRRITGGGAVYHDMGNVNYSFITSSDKAQSLDYEYFTMPIIKALSSLGLTCYLSGRNDIICESKKISGNAQYSANGRILHHGTLLFDADVDTMTNVLRANKEKLEFNAVKSHASRVTNLRTILGKEIDVFDFIEKVKDFVVEYFNAEIEEISENDGIRHLYERNSSDEWIYSDKRYLVGYKSFKHKKFPFGMVYLEIKWDKDIIDDIVISGDFFERLPIEELEAIIKGKKVSELVSIDPSNYIDKMTSFDLISLIKD